MNDDLRPMLRDAGVALAALTAGAGVFGGAWVALATAVSGLMTIVNFALLAALLRLSARATAAGRGAGPALALLFLKTGLLLVVFMGLVSIFGTIGPALGAGTVVLALTVRGLVDALTVSDDELPEGIA